MGRPLGFLMIGTVLMLIATLLQIGSFTSPNEVIGILFIFTVLAFCFNLGTTLKIFESFDGNDCQDAVSNQANIEVLPDPIVTITQGLN